MKISKGHIESKLNFVVKKTGIFLVLAIVITIAATIPPFAEATDPPLIELSKSVYNKGDIIVVFGTVPVVFQEVPEITIKIMFTDQLIDVAQVEVAQDGTFATDFNTSASIWAHDGQYTVHVLYTADISGEITFDFFQNLVVETSSYFPVNIPNSGTFDLEYTARGFDVTDIELNQDRYSLLIEIGENSGGNLVLKLPRESFDAKTYDGADDIFIILIAKDNEPNSFVEVQYDQIDGTPTFRTISIQVEEDERFIEIIGTYVIPEFGSIVIIVLLLAITSVIIISKNKLSFSLYPKI